LADPPVSADVGGVTVPPVAKPVLLTSVLSFFVVVVEAVETDFGFA
jgi:hypothetical protein